MNPKIALPAVLPAPVTCPFCRAPTITTTSEKVDAASYWRCATCGEVWNVARLRVANRYASNRR